MMNRTTAAERAEMVGQNAIENEMTNMTRSDYASYEAYLRDACKRALRNVTVYVDGHNDARSGNVEEMGGRVSYSAVKSYLRKR